MVNKNLSWQTYFFINTVKPELTTTCELRPPVNNGQFDTLTASLNLSFIWHLFQTATFSGPKGSRCTQVWLCSQTCANQQPPNKKLQPNNFCNFFLFLVVRPKTKLTQYFFVTPSGIQVGRSTQFCSTIQNGVNSTGRRSCFWGKKVLEREREGEREREPNLT